IQKAKAAAFREKTLTTGPAMQLFLTPPIPETEALQIWLTIIEASTSSSPLNRKASMEKTIAYIHACSTPNHSHQVVIVGTIIHLNMDNYYYPACSRIVNGKQCRKKLSFAADSTWHCTRCNLATATCEYRYALHMMVEDRTGTIWETTFEDVALALLGVSATSLKEQSKSTNDSWNIIKHGLFHTYRCIFSVSPTTYKGKEQLSCTIHNITGAEQDSDHAELVVAFLEASE
ncbi:hypothetical protein KI387_004235, partial [Taxus chinensis]